MLPDVLIPARDADPADLDRAVRSALGVAGPGHVVVIDDASSPPLDLGGLAPGVRLVRSEVHLGVSAARNLAIEHASSDLLLFLDADDVLLRAGVRSMVALLARAGAVAGVAARHELRRPNPGEAPRLRLRPVPAEWADSILPTPADAFRPIAIFGSSGLLVRRGVPDLRFDPDLEIGEDRDLVARLARHGPVVLSADPALVVTLHGRGGANLTSDRRLERRIRDHLVLMARHFDHASAQHFGEATRWLINRASRARVGDEAWNALLRAARDRRLPVPLKARLRRRLA